MVTLTHTTNIYDVEYEERYYCVTFSTDENNGYTDISIMEEGEPIEDKKLINTILDYVQKELKNGEVS